VKIYVTTMEAFLKKEFDIMKLNLPPKLVEILVWVPFILFCKNFIPNYVFDAMLC